MDSDNLFFDPAKHTGKFLDNYQLLIPSGKFMNGEAIPTPSYNAHPNLIIRHVWSEGYSATGEHGTATYHGCCIAETHEEACLRIVNGIDKNEDGSLSLRGGMPSVWACRLFDNEADARKSNG